jgi:hypothetical protein
MLQFDLNIDVPTQLLWTGMGPSQATDINTPKNAPIANMPGMLAYISKYG